MMFSLSLGIVRLKRCPAQPLLPWARLAAENVFAIFTAGNKTRFPLPKQRWWRENCMVLFELLTAS